VTQWCSTDLKAGTLEIKNPVSVVEDSEMYFWKNQTVKHYTLNAPTRSAPSIQRHTKEEGVNPMVNIYGNKSVKCNKCKKFYCTPEENPTTCDQCGSLDIELLSDAEATQLIRDTFRRSPEAGAAPR